MKKIITLLLSFLLGLSLTACTSDEVKKLMDEKKYEEAYELIQKDKDKYGKYLDECNYYLGNDSMKNEYYDSAIQYFEQSDFKKSKEKLDKCRYYRAEECIDNKKYNEARTYLEDNKYEKSKELLSTISSDTKNYYTIATTLTKYDLSKDSLGMYSYDGITLLTDDCEWVDSWLNKNGSVESGALYRKLAAYIEGFNNGFNNGSSFSKHILGFSTNSREEFAPYVSDLATYIVKEDSLKCIMSKFSTLSTVSGKIDTNANSYNFKITDLKKCAEELKISEEMLGYILADLDEYGPTVEFGKNDYSFILN